MAMAKQLIFQPADIWLQQMRGVEQPVTGVGVASAREFIIGQT